LLDIIVIIFVFVIGFSVKNWVGVPFDAHNKKILNRLWLYHLLFGVIYWAYIAYGPGGDASHYYKAGKALSFTSAIDELLMNGPGNVGMYLLNAFPAKVLSFFSVSLIYTLLGYVGMVFFYGLFNSEIKYNSRIGNIKLFPFIFFLPNLHFWSAGLGKDTICFLAIALFSYSMLAPRKHIIKIILALILTYIVRPHISMFLVAAFGMAFLLDGNLSKKYKIILGLIFTGVFSFLFFQFLVFMKMESLNAEAINSFSETSTGNLTEGAGSGVDISAYPYPLKVLTFLYRPFFFDINSILAVVASFENLLLLILSIKFIRLNPFKLFKRGNYIFKGMFLFFLMGALTFSLILGNLGIMLREKNMFTPALLFICLWGLSYSYQQKQAAKKPS